MTNVYVYEKIRKHRTDCLKENLPVSDVELSEKEYNKLKDELEELCKPANNLGSKVSSYLKKHHEKITFELDKNTILLYGVTVRKRRS